MESSKLAPLNTPRIALKDNVVPPTKLWKKATVNSRMTTYGTTTSVLEATVMQRIFSLSWKQFGTIIN
jgi:hypothetical protein